MTHVHSKARDLYFYSHSCPQFIRAYDYSKLKDKRPKFEEEKQLMNYISDKLSYCYYRTFACIAGTIACMTLSYKLVHNINSIYEFSQWGFCCFLEVTMTISTINVHENDTLECKIA